MDADIIARTKAPIAMMDAESQLADAKERGWL
jgi:hypothetical protein